MRYLDLILALVICGAAGVALAHALGRIEYYNEQSSILERPLTPGTTRYEFLARGRCIGELAVDLSDQDDQLGILLKGEIRTSLRGQAQVVEIDGDFAFNLVGQLGGGFVKFILGAQKITLGLEDINPIKLTIIAPVFGIDSRRQLSFPGPIELTPDRSGAYRLHYRPLSGTHAPLNFIIDKVQSDLELEVTSSAGKEGSCEDSEEALALDSLADKWTEQAQGLIRLLPRQALGVR
jgi:hypothetical protein